MARSSMMRWVRTLARNQALAQRLGRDPAEVYALSRERELSRRELLAGMGALGVAAGALGGARPARAANPGRIAIVGAGIAGMSAALTLADKGLTATIYEASDRVGGRMHSETSYWSYPSYAPVSEYCGEMIDSDHTTMMRLAARFGLALTDMIAAEPPGSTETYYLQSGPNSTIYEYYEGSQAAADFVAVYRAASRDASATGGNTVWNSYNSYGLAFDKVSVYDWIADRVPGGLSSRMGRLLNSAYEQEYGAPTDDQSSLNIVYALSAQPAAGAFSIYGSSDQRFHIRGGNDQLPKAIAQYLLSKGHPPVRSGRRLQAISQTSSGAALTFDANGAAETVVADHVILTVPFSVLRTLDTSAAQFDARKTKAITELGSGRNAKLILQYTNRIWNQQGVWGTSNGDLYTDLGFKYFGKKRKYLDDGPQAAWDTTRGQPGPYGLITNYTGGDAASAFVTPAPYLNASAPSVAGYAKAFAQAFDKPFPGSAELWNGRAILSTPFTDPNLRLSYSYWRVGQYTGFAGYEGVAQGLVHFAGEHCSVDFQGFMEGAAREGRRAALEVVNATGGG